MDEPAMDERAALKELERLQEQIQHYRAQRRAVGDQFEQFVRSFKTPPETAEAPPRAPVPHAAPPAAAERTPDPSPPSVESAAPSAGVERGAAPPLLPAPLVRRQTVPKAGVLIGGALALLAGGALVTWTLRPRAPESSTAGAATPVAPPALPAAPEPAPATRPVVESVLTTSGAVWVRVIADGERVLERELPPNARVPLSAEKTVVIRAGDAGAVRLTLRGQDQGVLGRVGEVVTRRFTVPPAQTGK